MHNPADAATCPTLSIVIPAFNEAENVAPVIAEVTAALAERRTPSYEIILVDDGSSDGTWQIMSALRDADSRHIRTVRHERNRGFGAALRTGYELAKGEFVTLMSSDGEFDPRELLNLFDSIGDADIVVSRRVRGDAVNSTLRSMLSKGMSSLTRWLLKFDPGELMGIYVVRGDVLRKLTLLSHTGLMNTELQMRCFAMGCNVRYGTVRVRPRLAGESKVTNLRTAARTFFEMLRLRLRGTGAQ